MKLSPIGWWTHRREPIQEATTFPQTIGTPLPISHEVEIPAPPVPYGSWWNVGRDNQHDNFHRQIPRQNLAIVDWLSVQALNFLPGMKANPTSLITPYQPVGFFNPPQVRSNIESPPQTSLSMISAVRAPILYNDNYLKLM